MGTVADERVPEPPPGYVWVRHAPIPPEPAWRPPRWLVIVVAIWSVALLAGAVIYARAGKPTVRDQTTVVGAIPTVDTAIGDVVAAAGAGPVVAVDGFVKVGSCRITPVRPGVEYQRSVIIYTAPHTESALLATIAAGLPRDWRPVAGPGALQDLSADAGDYVGVSGTVPVPGEIEIRAATGCRAQGGTIPSPPAAPATPEIRTVLGALGLGAASSTQAQVACPGGAGTIRTVTAHVPPGRPVPALATALATVAPEPVLASTNLVAFHTATGDVSVSADPSGVTITDTTRC